MEIGALRQKVRDLRIELNEATKELKEAEDSAFKESHGFGIGDIIEYRYGTTGNMCRMLITKIKGDRNFWIDGRKIKKDGTLSKQRGWITEGHYIKIIGFWDFEENRIKMLENLELS